MLWRRNKFAVNRLSDHLLVLILTSLFFRCLGSPWVRFIGEPEQLRLLRVGRHTSLHSNTRDQSLEFDSTSHLRTLRDGVQETIEALPTKKPSYAGKRNPFNHFNNSPGLTNPNNDSSAGSTIPSLPYQSDRNKATGKKRYRFVKGAKTESGMVKSYASEPNLKTFSMEKPQSFDRPSPIKALEKITDPHPERINSIKSKLEEFESPLQIESIKDRFINVPLIPKIEDIPSIDAIPAIDEITSINDPKSEINEFDSKDNRIKVEKRHIFSTKKNNSVIKLHFHTDFKSVKTKTKAFHKNTKGKSQEKLQLNRFLVRKLPVVELKDHERKQERTAKHSVAVTGNHGNTTSSRKGRLDCIFNRRGPLCALRRTKQCRTLTRLLQNNFRKLKLARNPGELTGTERIYIESPKPIEPIDKIMVDFEVVKAIEDIQAKTVKVENVEKIEDIGKQLQDIKQQPKVHPIIDCMLKIKPIPPVAPQQPIKSAL